MSKQKQTNSPVSEAEKLLSQYRSRLAAEGWIKSALCGLTVAFALNIIYTFVCLLFGIKLYWMSAVLFVVGAATTPLFYFGKFKQSLREVASRVDTLGLEERVLTMSQLEGNDSFMARRQREDTIRALKTVNASLIKLAVSVPLIVMCAATFVVSATTTTANALVDRPLIDIIGDSTKQDDVFYKVTYEVQGNVGGIIAGLTEQQVKAGAVASPVQAIAEDGYVFTGWTDGYDEAFRADADVTGEIHVYAIFTLLDDTDLDEPGDENENGNEADKSSKGESSSTDSNMPKPGDPSDPDNEENGGGAGGSSLPSNKYMDGKTYYGDDYGNSLSDAQDAVNSNTDLTGDQSDVISDYFNNIAK